MVALNTMTQLEFPFFELPVYPIPFMKPYEFASYMLDKAHSSLFSQHTEWLIQQKWIMTCISVIPSFIFERIDGIGWDKRTLIAYGWEMFQGEPFREITMKTAGGVAKRLTKAELTTNMNLVSDNFKEIWRHDKEKRQSLNMGQ